MAKTNWNKIDVSRLNFNDKKTWELISAGLTDGVFQLESAGMKEVCKRIKPQCMEDLIAILALYRPDTMSELEHFIRRRNGEEEITYIHDDLKQILSSTYGCILYQEQIMAIVKVFGGFNDTESDMFRKGVGKKDAELVQEQADKFYHRAIKNGYDVQIVNELTNLLKEMGGYCFNKGHSAGYALTSFKTAYLKANYPKEFMCSLLSNQKKATGQVDYDNVGIYAMHCIEMGIGITYPDINISQAKFTVIGDNINFGLLLLKGIGESAVREIIKHRPYNSLYHFLNKTSKSGQVNKTAVISLIKANAFLFEKKSRKELLKLYGEYRFENCMDAIRPIQNINKTHIEKLITLNKITPYQAEDEDYALNIWNKYRYDEFMSEWHMEVMEGTEHEYEYDSLSCHLIGNPFQNIKLPLWDSFEDGSYVAKVGGTIISLKKIKVKKGKSAGKQMAFISLDTIEGIREITVFADDYEKWQDRLEKGNIVVIRGMKQGDKLLMNGMKSLEEYIRTEC